MTSKSAIGAKCDLSAASGTKRQSTSPKSPSAAASPQRTSCAPMLGSSTGLEILGRMGTGANEVVLPWPPRELSPNWRGHWSKKATAAKRYRLACFVLAKEAGLAFDGPGEVHLWITFNKPSRRAMDDDNLIASFKAGRDGLADALKIDDARFVCHPFVSDRIAGSVVVRLSAGPGA